MAVEKLTEHGRSQQGQVPVRRRSRVLIVLAALGPGVVAAMAGNDAGGISTYSTIGAMFGYGTLWIIPIMMVMLAIVQEGASRMGAVTGKGLASLIREQFGVRLTALAMIAVLIESGAATLSEFAGIAAGMELFGVSKYIAVPIAGVVVWLLVMGGSYKRVEKVFLAISCVFVTYVIAAFLAQPDWGEVGTSLVIPHFENNPSFISLVIATVGTTIAPWMIFLTQNNVVDKGVTPDELSLERVDAIGGAIVACAVAQFVSGVLLPVILIFMVRILSSKRIMRSYANKRLLTVLVWALIVVVFALTIGCFVMTVLGF